LVVSGNAFCTALQQFEIAKAARGSSLSSKSQHLRADVHTNDTAIRAHGYGRPLGHGPRSCTKIKDIPVGTEIGAGDHSPDDRREPLVNLPQIDVRDAVPNPGLPRKTFPVLIRIDHDLLLLAHRLVVPDACTVQASRAPSRLYYPFCVHIVRYASEFRCCRLPSVILTHWRWEACVPILPRDVKAAVELLKRHPARECSIDELAAACGVARRTLEKHFRRFAGRTPSQARREVRLDLARRELLRAQPDASVTDIAERCGFNHLGRFAAAYGERYGEVPSATLQRRRQVVAPRASSLTLLSPALDRPVIAVRPFNLIGTRASRADTIAEEISAALLRNRWLAVGAPDHARYHLRGTVREDGGQRLRIMAMLTEAASGRHLWAGRWDGELDD